MLGTLGFDYAQVTKGGVRLAEVNNDLMSKNKRGCIFAVKFWTWTDFAAVIICIGRLRRRYVSHGVLTKT